MPFYFENGSIVGINILLYLTLCFIVYACKHASSTRAIMCGWIALTTSYLQTMWCALTFWDFMLPSVYYYVAIHALLSVLYTYANRSLLLVVFNILYVVHGLMLIGVEYYFIVGTCLGVLWFIMYFCTCPSLDQGQTNNAHHILTLHDVPTATPEPPIVEINIQTGQAQDQDQYHDPHDIQFGERAVDMTGLV